jgi:glyoxylase-like metal-dependent hydrolase (beta-lactamase superfamily II)
MPEFARTNRFSRRSFLSAAGTAATGAWLGGWRVWAQAAVGDKRMQAIAAAASAKITVQPLRERVSVLKGSGGNIAVLISVSAKADADGKLMVDSGFSSSQPQMMAALAGINGDPVRMLINTHWHYDHVDGNEWVHGTGATVLAHEKTRDRMSKPGRIDAFDITTPASPAGALPTELFRETKTLHRNGATLELKHYTPAHTDTDISVHFIEADVLHVGDTWFNGFYPFMDYSSGGNIDGMIKATEANLALAGSKTIIIPGHGPVGDKVQLSACHQMLVECRANVAALKKQGKPLPEVQAAKPTAAFDAKWGAGFLTPEAFVGLVYQGV